MKQKRKIEKRKIVKNELTAYCLQFYNFALISTNQSSISFVSLQVH